jgi:hypothetical protein
MFETITLSELLENVLNSGGCSRVLKQVSHSLIIDEAESCSAVIGMYGVDMFYYIISCNIVSIELLDEVYMYSPFSWLEIKDHSVTPDELHLLQQRQCWPCDSSEEDFEENAVISMREASITPVKDWKNETSDEMIDDYSFRDSSEEDIGVEEAYEVDESDESDESDEAELTIEKLVKYVDEGKSTYTSEELLMLIEQMPSKLTNVMYDMFFDDTKYVMLSTDVCANSQIVTHLLTRIKALDEEHGTDKHGEFCTMIICNLYRTDGFNEDTISMMYSLNICFPKESSEGAILLTKAMSSLKCLNGKDIVSEARSILIQTLLALGADPWFISAQNTNFIISTIAKTAIDFETRYACIKCVLDVAPEGLCGRTVNKVMNSSIKDEHILALLKLMVSVNRDLVMEHKSFINRSKYACVEYLS